MRNSLLIGWVASSFWLLPFLKENRLIWTIRILDVGIRVVMLENLLWLQFSHLKSYIYYSNISINDDLFGIVWMNCYSVVSIVCLHCWQESFRVILVRKDLWSYCKSSFYLSAVSYSSIFSNTFDKYCCTSSCP